MDSVLNALEAYRPSPHKKKHIKGIFLLSIFSKQRTQDYWWWSHLPDVLQQMCTELVWLQDSSCQLLHHPELTGAGGC